MRVPVVSLGHKLPLVAIVILLIGVFAQPPAAVAADDAAALAPSASQLNRDLPLQTLSEDEGGVPLVAEALAGEPTHFVKQVVALDDPEPVLGSFTVNGMTFAVTGEGEVELAAVGTQVLAAGLASDLAGGSGEDDGEETLGASAASLLVSDGDGPSVEFEAPEGDDPSDAPEPVVLTVPSSVEHDGTTYAVTSVGPRALAGRDADAVVLPTTVESVDGGAIRGSAVEAIEVVEGNQHLASYEGVLYDADFSSLLLIPEGKKGVVRIHSNTSAIPPDVLSHCALVTSVEVDAGNETFYVEDEALRNRSMEDDGGFIADFGAAGVYKSGYGCWLTGISPAGRIEPEILSPTETSVSYATETSTSNPRRRFCYIRYTCPAGTSSIKLKVPYHADGFGAFAGYSKTSVDGPVTYPVDSTFTLDLYSTSDVPDNKNQLYCVYGRKTATISFNANGGAGGQSANVTATYNSAMPTISTTKPTRTGYTFAGWWDGADCSAPDAKRYYTAEGASARAWDKAQAATLYAGWEAIPYAISYDAQGGELSEGARSSYTIEDAFELPSPVRYGYQLQGWEVAGAGEGGAIQGSGVEDVPAADGSKVTRVRQGTYGDLSCTARWALRYDLDVPVADPGSVTFEADSLTGEVRVAPGTSAEGSILSYMAVPVSLESLSCEGLDASGEVPDSGGAPELEAVFGPGASSKVRFTAALEADGVGLSLKVSPGQVAAPPALATLSIPAATSHDDPGRLAVTYGLELDPDLPIPPVREAAPVARLAYTVSLLAPST